MWGVVVLDRLTGEEFMLRALPTEDEAREWADDKQDDWADVQYDMRVVRLSGLFGTLA